MLTEVRDPDILSLGQWVGLRLLTLAASRLGQGLRFRLVQVVDWGRTPAPSQRTSG
jgi:hypothetical protein